MNEILNLVLLRLNALVLKRETLIYKTSLHTLEKHLLSHPIPKHLLDLSDKELLNPHVAVHEFHVLPAPLLSKSTS